MTLNELRQRMRETERSNVSDEQLAQWINDARRALECAVDPETAESLRQLCADWDMQFIDMKDKSPAPK